MDKEEIESGLEAIARIAAQDGVFLELAVYGGSAIALKWEFRKSTRDVDIIVSGDAAYIRQAAMRVAIAKGWPENWMNDAVKGFASPAGDHELYKEYTSENGGIKVFVPSTRYLLAMKCMAMRIDEPDGHNDVDDIIALIKESEINTENELFELIESYYPTQKISTKTLFGIQEIMRTRIGSMLEPSVGDSQPSAASSTSKQGNPQIQNAPTPQSVESDLEKVAKTIISDASNGKRDSTETPPPRSSWGSSGPS